MKAEQICTILRADRVLVEFILDENTPLLTTPGEARELWENCPDGLKVPLIKRMAQF